MYENGLYPEKAYRKCADTVGSVLGRYHPHGDASVYDAMVRLAQDFSMRYPLVDGHGNFGSVDGDPPAAYRYTESRMSKISMEMLTNLDKDTVDMMRNYDDRLNEPVVLPSRFPNASCKRLYGYRRRYGHKYSAAQYARGNRRHLLSYRQSRRHA